MDYRIQRLKEDLTNAQQRNKKQRIQLANYKRVHERDLETIKKQKEVIDKTIELLNNHTILLPTEYSDEVANFKRNLRDILKKVDND